MTKGPGEQVDVQAVTGLGEAAVGGRHKLRGTGPEDGTAMQRRPLAERAEYRQGARLQPAAGVWPDVEEEVPPFGHAVDQHPDQHVGRLPVQVVAVVTPAAVEGLARLP